MEGNRVRTSNFGGEMSEVRMGVRVVVSMIYISICFLFSVKESCDFLLLVIGLKMKEEEDSLSQ